MGRPNLICVLSGGGAKAAAQVGALRALEEHDVVPTRFVATSMGAVVAACFASGLSYDDVLNRVMHISRQDVARVSPTVFLGPFIRSLFREQPLRDTIGALVPARGFGELAIPLTITAVDIDTGELVLFGSGGRSDVPLLEALYASCALPLFYPPAEIGRRRYVDGGLRAVLPLDVAGGFEPDAVFAVHVGPSFAAPAAAQPPSIPPMMRAHNEAMRVLMAAQVDEAVERWKDRSIPLVLVEPPLERQATFALANIVRYVEEGYRTASRALESSTAWARLRASAPGATE